MRKGFFRHLAAVNIRKNAGTYIPYILTCIVTVAMFYIVKSLSLNPGLEQMIGSDTLIYILELGTQVVAVFAFIFLFYTNSFLMKRRKKEFGVLNVLGLEKRHLSRVILWETLYVVLISLVCGLVLGIVLDKAMYLLIGRIVGARVTLGFFVSASAIVTTILLFAGIFILINVNSVWQIFVSNTIELLHGGNTGEKEPKTKWLMTAAGVVSLGAGYYIALTTKNPVASVLLFFVAVILVIIGTYLLFTAGSIAFLKLMRKNKKYYYKKNHFVSVSGMIYRMKQNAVGLANICILSTMVLVMLSTTTSLMAGLEDIIRTRYPNDFAVYSSEDTAEKSEAYFDSVRGLQKEAGIRVTGEIEYTYLSVLAFRNGSSYSVEITPGISDMGMLENVMFMPLSDYNRLTGETKILAPDEVMIYSYRTSFDGPEMCIEGRTYKIRERLDDFQGNGMVAANIRDMVYVVVSSMDEIHEIDALQRAVLSDTAYDIRRYYGFDVDASEDEKMQFYEDYIEWMTKSDHGYSGTFESRAEARSSINGIYGGLFFIGIFLGLLFTMATVLIIYYKQISEGYEDKERFAIMQKVGMSAREVRATIHSQVLSVFFLPVLVAGVHVAVAFPIISKLLSLMNLKDTGLFALCTIICYLVFTAVYILIYILTAKAYYRIVSKSKD